MSSSRFATPLMLSLAASGTLGLATAQQVEAFGISDMSRGYGLVEDANKTEKKQETPPEQKAEHEGKCGEGKCGEGKCGTNHDKKADEHKCAEGKCGEGKCGEAQCDAEHHEKSEGDKSTEGKCGEGKCGEGKCGGAA